MVKVPVPCDGLVLLEVSREREAERRAFSASGCALAPLLGRTAKGKGAAAPVLPTRRKKYWHTEADVLARGTLLRRGGRYQQQDMAQDVLGYGLAKAAAAADRRIAYVRVRT